MLDDFYAFFWTKSELLEITFFFSSNMDAQLLKVISRGNGLQETMDLGRYLGVPIIHYRISKMTYNYILDNCKRLSMHMECPNAFFYLEGLL